MNTAKLRSFARSFSVRARQDDVQQVVESKAIYYAFLCFIVTGIATAFLFYGHGIPLFGRVSIGVTASFFGFIGAFAAYFLSAQWQRLSPRNKHSQVYVKWAHDTYTNLSLALVFALVALLLLAGTFRLLQDAFSGLAFDSWSAAALTAAAVAAAGYIAFLGAAEMNASRLSILLAVFLVAGVMTSMITAEYPYWWQYHFSYLGAGGTFSSRAFNLSLIIGGGVIAALSDYVASDFANMKTPARITRTAKVNLVRTVLVGIGICLALVGIFAFDTSPTIHKLAAGMMAILFIALVCALPFVAPVFSRAFYQLSFTLVAALIIGYVLFDVVGYLNLTAFELLAASVIFTWIVLFIRQIGALPTTNRK